MKKVSVIILSYNNCQMLYETIDSVLKQNYGNIEIIIADDHGANFDTETVKQYIDSKKEKNISNLNVYQNSSNFGTVRNLNEALKIASGDFIKIIAGDDAFPDSNVFSNHVSNLENNSDAFFTVGDIVQCDSELKPYKSLGFFNHQVDLDTIFEKSNIKKLIRFYPYLLSIQSITFRKKYFERYGLFDERYKLVEDLPFLVKVLDNRIRFSYIHIDSVYHRNDAGVSSNKSNRFDNRKLNYYKDIYNYFQFDLAKYKKTIGSFFYSIKKSVSKFRVQYTESKSKLLFVKYFPTLLMYLFIK